MNSDSEMYRGICHNNNIKDGKRQSELKILVQKPCHPSPGLSSCSALGPRSLSLDTAACSAGACDGPVKTRPWDPRSCLKSYPDSHKQEGVGEYLSSQIWAQSA